jgi:hypothetical protein
VNEEAMAHRGLLVPKERKQERKKERKKFDIRGVLIDVY